MVYYQSLTAKIKLKETYPLASLSLFVSGMILQLLSSNILSKKTVSIKNRTLGKHKCLLYHGIENCRCGLNPRPSMASYICGRSGERRHFMRAATMNEEGDMKPPESTISEYVISQ